MEVVKRRRNNSEKQACSSNHTAWKVSKYGVFSGLYFPVFRPNAGKYGPEKTPYLVTFHAVSVPSARES